MTVESEMSNGFDELRNIEANFLEPTLREWPKHERNLFMKLSHFRNCAKSSHSQLTEHDALQWKPARATELESIGIKSVKLV